MTHPKRQPSSRWPVSLGAPLLPDFGRKPALSLSKGEDFDPERLWYVLFPESQKLPPSPKVLPEQQPPRIRFEAQSAAAAAMPRAGPQSPQRNPATESARKPTRAFPYQPSPPPSRRAARHGLP